MSREVIIKTRDDLDRTLDADEEVRLGVDDVTHVLDLTTAHAEQPRAELAPWLAAAHETIRSKRRPRDKSTVADRLGSKSGSAPQPTRQRRTPKTAVQPYRRRSGLTAASRAIPDPELRWAITAWGPAHGFKVARSGFLSPDLVAAYQAGPRQARRG